MTQEQTEGRITVYRESTDKMFHFTLLEIGIDTNVESTDTYIIQKSDDATVSLKIDIYRPMKRRIETLEREVEMLEAYIERLAENDDTED